MNFLKRLFGRPTKEQEALAGVLMIYLQFRLDGHGDSPPAKAARLALHIYPKDDVLEMLKATNHPKVYERLFEGHPHTEWIKRMNELGKVREELRVEHQAR